MIKTLIFKGTKSEVLKEDQIETVLSTSDEKSISSENFITLGKDKELDIIKIALDDESDEYKELLKSKDCLGSAEDFKKDNKELYEKVTLVAIKLPSPRQEVGMDGKTVVTVTGGVRFVSIADAKAQDLEPVYIVEHKLGGEE